MDGADGEKHPLWGARWADKHLGQEYGDLVAYHSRHYARIAGKEVSALCWADKASVLFDPWWLYLPRAWVSGELKEYRQEASDYGAVPLSFTHRRWLAWYKDKVVKQLITTRKADSVTYFSKRKDS
jgi:hypothetical protein